jgi:hypothetical protein
MNADAASTAFSTLAFDSIVLANADAAAVFASTFLHSMLANAASAAFFATGPHFQVRAYPAAAAFFALAFLPLVNTPSTSTAVLASTYHLAVYATTRCWALT